MSKFNLLLESRDLDLVYYSFDWDDNILHMSTMIHMDVKKGDKWVPVDVSTSEFAIVRNDKEGYRLRNDSPSEAFSEFRDSGPRGETAFIDDVKLSISQNQFGPSWEAFLKCLIGGNIFSIITARGHEPETIRKAIEYIIDNVLDDDQRFVMYSNCLTHSYIFTKKEYDRIPRGLVSKTPLIKIYLDNCDFYGVSSDSFAREFGASSASNPEKAKAMALDKFIDKCSSFGGQVGAKSVSIGFSDDDKKNVSHVEKFFKEKSALTNTLHNMKFSLYDTSDRTVPGGKKVKIHKESSHRAVGMDSSVASFSQFNNMANRLFPKGPNSQDATPQIQDGYISQIDKWSKSAPFDKFLKLRKRRRRKRK